MPRHFCVLMVVAVAATVSCSQAAGIANKAGNVVVSIPEGGALCLDDANGTACVRPSTLVTKADLAAVDAAAKDALVARAAEVQIALDALTSSIASDKLTTAGDIAAATSDFNKKLGEATGIITTETDNKLATTNSKLDKIMECAENGQMLGADNKCVTIFPQCPNCHLRRVWFGGRFECWL
jgi:hypothetical protein